MRLVCQFSCGAASAVATKLTIHENPDAQILIVNAFIVEEHPDNRRFLRDCEGWFGIPVTVLQDTKYHASTDEVWARKRYIKGPRGAPCSATLKRDLLSSISHPGDISIIGFTAEEEDRFDDLCTRFHNETFRAPLIEKHLTKSDCLALLQDARIPLPTMYLLGYTNANCIGCPKGGQNYWQAIREDFPKRFAAVRTIQESIGAGAYFLRFRSGPRKGQRMSLADLPPGRGNMDTEPSFSCSFHCELTSNELDLRQ